MTINIQGTNIELTPSLKAYFNEKIDSALTAFGNTDRDAVVIDLEIEQTTNRHQHAQDLYRAEANVSVPGGMIRAEESGETPQAAIDMMRDILEREIREWHKREIQDARKGARKAKEMLHSPEGE